MQNYQVEESISVSLEDLLVTQTRDELDALLQQAAEENAYFCYLNLAWDYWHYGRHAEYATELGMRQLGRLFSAAWQIELRVHDQDEAQAEEARTQIQARYPAI